MTDKVQKIRKEVARIQLYTQSEVLKQVLDYIDEVQKESVSKVWHYQKKEPVNEIADKSRPIIVVYGNNSLNAAGKFRYYEDNSDAIWLSDSYEKWAFIEDLINLSQSVKTSDQKEPVSEPNEQLAETYLAVFDKKFPILPTLKGKQLADYKNFLNKCQQIFGLKEWGICPIQAKLFEKLSLLWAAWGVEHLQGVGRQDKKEQDIPVSENLEEAALEYANNQLIKSGVTDTNCPRELAVAQASLMVNGFKTGAKWQKEKDYKDGLENDDFLTFAYMDGMEEGKKIAKQQMMKDAIECQVEEGGMYPAMESIPVLTNTDMIQLPKDKFEVGDKVKLIIIKQEEE